MSQLAFFESGDEDTVTWTPTREAGLARLNAFLPRTGRAYASGRNYDHGPSKHTQVSCLSPWVRHRLICEEEILRETLARHSLSSAEKFVQEVFWRGYFKGWMERRPSIWTSYLDGLAADRAALDLDRRLRKAVDAAEAGSTGLACMDAWTEELVETGYLHNHARMWFASIWIFTLRLPWELGADFFLRHLLDGDPASNTLSWRWVAGLHTKGKTYQARASNISKYTEGRFRPIHQLSPEAEPLAEQAEHPKVPVPLADAMPEGDALLLVTEEEGCAETLLPRPPVAALGLLATADRSSLPVGDHAMRFAKGAVEDVLARTGVEAHMGAGDWAEAIIAAAGAAGTQTVVTAYAPVGAVASRLAKARPALEAAGVRLHQVRRRYDDLAWPHATKGFFALKQKIPQVLRDLELLHE